MTIQIWFPLELTGLISLPSKTLSRVFSSTTIWNHQFFSAQPSLRSNSHNYSCEIKRCFLLARKALTKLDSILKNRDITLPANVCRVKAIVFPVVMYRCERCCRHNINWNIQSTNTQWIKYKREAQISGQNGCYEG